MYPQSFPGAGFNLIPEHFHFRNCLGRRFLLGGPGRWTSLTPGNRRNSPPPAVGRFLAARPTQV